MVKSLVFLASNFKKIAKIKLKKRQHKEYVVIWTAFILMLPLAVYVGYYVSNDNRAKITEQEPINLDNYILNTDVATNYHPKDESTLNTIVTTDYILRTESILNTVVVNDYILKSESVLRSVFLSDYISKAESITNTDLASGYKANSLIATDYISKSSFLDSSSYGLAAYNITDGSHLNAKIYPKHIFADTTSFAVTNTQEESRSILSLLNTYMPADLKYVEEDIDYILANPALYKFRLTVGDRRVAGDSSNFVIPDATWSGDTTTGLSITNVPDTVFSITFDRVAKTIIVSDTGSGTTNSIGAIKQFIVLDV